MLLLEAMAHQEGFFGGDPNARPRRNNNPLDLEWGEEAARFGALHGDPRFAVFEDVHTGWTAAARWLSIPAKFNAQKQLVEGYLGATIEQAIYRFSPPNENNTGSYLAFILKSTGYTADMILTAAMLQIPSQTQTKKL